MEATWDWYWVYDPLEGAGLEISLVHPLKAKAIASASIRSDRLDSRILAHLLRSDLLPCAYIPSRGTRERRELLRYRAFPSLRSGQALVHQQTALKNRIHALLDKLHQRPPVRDPFSVAGWPTCPLCSLPIDPQGHVCPRPNGHSRQAVPDSSSGDEQ